MLTPQARLPSGLPNVDYVASLSGQRSQAACGAYNLATAFALRAVDLNHGCSRSPPNEAKAGFERIHAGRLNYEHYSVLHNIVTRLLCRRDPGYHSRMAPAWCRELGPGSACKRRLRSDD